MHGRRSPKKWTVMVNIPSLFGPLEQHIGLDCGMYTRNATNKTLALRCVALFVETGLYANNCKIRWKGGTWARNR